MTTLPRSCLAGSLAVLGVSIIASAALAQDLPDYYPEDYSQIIEASN